MEEKIVISEKPCEREKDIADVGQVNGGAIGDDMEYLDGIFDICADLMQRADLIKNGAVNSSETRQRRSTGDKSDKDRTESLTARINRIKKRIIKKENTFWRNISAKKEEGARFIIEEIAEHFGLEHFEKKVLFLFLYLGISEEKKSMSVSEVMQVLDLNGSFSGRLKKARFFEKTSSLVRNNIISHPAGHFPPANKQMFCINPGFYFTLSRMIDGEKISMEEFGKKEKENSYEDIGHLKDPDYSIEDIMVNEETREEVKLFLDAIKNKDLQKFGIFDKVRRGRGNVFLFYGPPGTGKSMMAEAVASYIGKKALVVEYPKIMSRWVGDTDKNIMKVFDSAKEHDVVIILDEADALLYSREYAQYDHDIRFVNEMLQALENFEGEIILTTNMDILLDSAVERRVSLKVKFELPDQKTRESIWRWHIPECVERSKDIDFGHLAGNYDFSGGNIKNAILNASRKSAVREAKILTMEDLVFGAELEKKGMFSRKHKTKVVKGFFMDHIHLKQ